MTLAHDLGDLHVGVGGDLAQDDYQAVGDGRLAGYPALGSSLHDGIQDGIRIWSQILSGCPSVTDSEVNRYLWRTA